MSRRRPPAADDEQSVQGTTLVVGTYPPLPGHSAAVTLAATRRAYGAGEEVVVVAPRPAAAHRTIRIEGPEAGPRLDAARRLHGTHRLVLCAEAGLPVPLTGRGSLGARASRGSRGSLGAARQVETVSGLADALDRFDHVTVVVAGDLGVEPAVLSPLWSHVDEVLFDGDIDADRASVATGLGLDPQRLLDAPARPLPVPVGRVTSGPDTHPEVDILRQALAARTSAYAQAGRPAGVTLFGPPTVLLRERPRQAISVGARAVLGPAAPVVRRGIVNVLRRARSSG